jgi:hypothetical protein
MKNLSAFYDHREYFFQYSVRENDNSYFFEVRILDESLEARFGTILQMAIVNNVIDLMPQKPFDAFIKRILLKAMCYYEDIGIEVEVPLLQSKK